MSVITVGVAVLCYTIAFISAYCKITTQDDFWGYHDYIYEQTLVAALEPEELVSYAAEIGLDSEQFESCLNSGKYKDYVAQDWQAALDAGGGGTPAFYINDEPVSPSYEVTAGTIREILNS